MQYVTLLISLFFVSQIIAEPTKGGLSLKGSIFSDLSLMHYYNSNERDSLGFGGLTTISLNAKNRNRKHAKVDASIEIKMPYGKGIGSSSTADDSSSTDSPIFSDYILFSMDNSILMIDIRRLYLSLYLPFADISIGRQIINFGKGTLFSPISVFSTVDIYDFTYRKNGSDIIKTAFPINNLWGIDLITELPYYNKEHTTAIKAYGNIKSFDLSLIGMYRHESEDILAGLEFKGDLILGVYSELLFNYKKNKSPGFDAMIGIDYSIRSKWIFIAEYLYTSNNHYHQIYGSVSFLINELLKSGVSIIQNFDQKSTLGTAFISYNILQNADITFYVRGYNNDPFGENLPAHDIDYALRVEVKF